MEKAVEWYHRRLLKSPNAGPARDYLRSRARLRRRGGPTVPPRGGRPTTHASRPKRCDCPKTCCRTGGSAVIGVVAPRTSSSRAFPICDPSGRPVVLVVRILPPRPSTARSTRAEVQELAGVTHLFERETLYASNWAKKGVISQGEVVVCEGYTDVIGCFQGRRAARRRHLWHGAGRGALHPAAQLRQAHRAGLRRRRGRAERHLPRCQRAGAQARGRRGGGGRPSRRQRPGGTGPQRSPTGPRAKAIEEARPLPAVPGGPHVGRGQPEDGGGSGVGSRSGADSRPRNIRTTSCATSTSCSCPTSVSSTGRSCGSGSPLPPGAPAGGAPSQTYAVARRTSRHYAITQKMMEIC